MRITVERSRNRKKPQFSKCWLAACIVISLIFTAGVVHKKCIGVTLDGSDDENYDLKTESGGITSKRIDFSLIYAAKAPATINDYPPNAISNVNFATENGLWNGWDFGIGIPTNGPILMLRFENIATVADLRTYLAANPVTIVYEVAEFYDDPMTASEVAAYHKLCTFSGTTNITCTDNPTIDIDYLLDTDNGQAVSAVQQGLQAQIIAIPAFIAAIPEMHRNIFRGQSLGSTVTAAQLAAIDDGIFNDLYVGDYWTIPVTIDGVTKNINWRIADIDYYLNVGDTPLTTLTAHHLVVIPDESLYDAQGVEIQNYATSTFRSTTLGTARTAISAAFPNMIITHRVLFETPTSETLAWSDSDVEIMRQVHIIGHNETAASGMYIFNVDYKQFALFAIAPKYILSNNDYWLRDTTARGYNYRASIISTQGIIGENDGTTASVQYGVRPYFLLGTMPT